MPGRLLVGFQDDPSLRWGADRASMLDRARRAGATVIRTTVDWSDAAPRRPSSPRSPFDPVYRLDDVDDLARQSQLRGMELLITIWGTPEWANGGQGRITRRSVRTTSPTSHRLSRTAIRGDTPAIRPCGSSPRGTSPISSCFWHPSSTPRAARWRPPPTHGLRKRSTTGSSVATARPSSRSARPRPAAATFQRQGPRRRATPRERSPGSWRTPTLSSPFDAWAQHPYPTRPNNPPAEPVRWPGVGLTSLERFGDARGTGSAETESLCGSPSTDTRRPREELGVSRGRSGTVRASEGWRAVGNPRVRMLVWFVLRDSPGNPWQSGLIDQSGS